MEPTVLPDTNQEERDLFGAFSLYPKGVKMSLLEENEEIILLVRQHPITMVKPFVLGLAFFIVLYISLLIVRSLNIIQVPFVTYLLIFGISFFYIYFNILNWIFNVGVVTNKRVIDVDVSGLIRTDSTSAHIYDIQEIHASSKGIGAGYFNYGSIYISTLAENGNIEFIMVPRPSDIVNLIENQRRRFAGSTMNVHKQISQSQSQSIV